MIEVLDEQHLRVGDRVWWGEFYTGIIDEPGLRWETRQFVVHFESKWSVSIIWGYSSYSDNHGLPWEFPTRPFEERPTLVEAAVLHSDRERLQPNGEPFGYLDDEHLNALLIVVSTLATDDIMDASHDSRTQ